MNVATEAGVWSRAQSRRDSVYRRVTTICDQVADAVLSGADVSELASTFASAIGKDVVLLDLDLAVQASASGAGADTTAPLWDPRDRGTRRLVEALAAERRPLRFPALPGTAGGRSCLAVPVAVGDTRLGYLLVLAAATESHDADLLAAGHAATLFALIMAREKTSTDLGYRHQHSLVDALVSGHFLDADDARRKALTLGFEGGTPFRVALFRLGSAERTAPSIANEIGETLAGRLADCHPRAVAVAHGGDVVMLAPVDDAATRTRGTEPFAAALDRLVSLLRARSMNTDATCGVSESTQDAHDAPQLFRQAEQAINLGLRIGRVGEVIVYERLGIYRLLFQIGDMRLLSRFADAILGPLIRYDMSHKVELVRTLSVYLTEHASLKQAARRLRIHVNTVSYRIQRIETLTTLDLGDAEDRLVAHVAVKIIESQRERRP